MFPSGAIGRCVPHMKFVGADHFHRVASVSATPIHAPQLLAILCLMRHEDRDLPSARAVIGECVFFGQRQLFGSCAEPQLASCSAKPRCSA